MSEQTLEELTIQPGLYTEATGRTSKGRWKDGNHVRFRDGLPESIGGFKADGRQVLGVARSEHEWSSLDTQIWLAIGTEARLYLLNGSSIYNITPIRETGTLTNPFQTTAGSSRVVVNDAAHGLQIGDIPNFAGSTAVGGLTLNGDFVVTEVISSSQYAIVASSNATATATGGGNVNYIYEISGVPITSVSGAGYGRGGYGSGGYGVPLIGADRRREIVRTWSLDNWGEDLVASPRNGAVYYWDRTNGPTVRAQLVATAPKKNIKVVVAHDERVLICYGTTPLGDDSTQDPMLIRWSDQEDYTNFVPTDENFAGDYRLGVGSSIVAVVRSRRETVIFTDKLLYGQQFTGSTADVYNIYPLGNTDEVLSQHAAVDVNGVVFYMCQRGFYVYDGVIRPVDCDVHTRVFDNIDFYISNHAVAYVDHKFNEVCWWYPSVSASDNDRYVVYNTKSKVWSYGTGDRTAVVDSRLFYGLPSGVRADGRVIIHESGTNDVGTLGEVIPLESFLESYDVEIPQDGNWLLHISKLVPDFQYLTGVGYISLSARKYPQARSTSYPEKQVTISTEKISVRIKGRQVSIKFRHAAVNSKWRMGQWRAEVAPHGKR